MKTTVKTLLIITFMLLAFSSYSQKSRMIGLWEAINVNVGEQNMTPVSKWFKFNSDGSSAAGNGWLQNSAGSWEYNEEDNTFSNYDSLGIEDRFGAFDVSFDKEYMYWEREEEGMKVKVTVKPIDELPMSPADYLEGIWDLESISEAEQDITDTYDPNNKHYLHFRWDRIIVYHTPVGERKTGYWHIHGHRSDITLLPHQEGEEAESWKIEVNEHELTMRGISESNDEIKRVYSRRRTFPE